MKKIVLFLCMLLVTAAYVHAQCDAPTNVQTDVNWSRVNLTWESSLQDSTGFDDELSYHQTGSLQGIGTGSALTFTCAVRYPVDSLTSRNGMYLTHVGITPASSSATTFTIKVWTGGSYTNETFDEGTLVSSTVVSMSELTVGEENIIRLNTPVLINATQELWVGYDVAATGDHPAGATTTPYLNTYNDLIYLGGWGTLAESSISFGWCINSYFMNSLPEITGFNIFRDGTQLNSSLITSHTFTDDSIAGQTQYCYTVQSVCSSTTSSSSPVCITTPIQPTCYPMIGNGTTTTSYFPFNAYYNYSYSQQIFDASELGAQAGTIASMTFQYMYSSPITMGNVTIYMANVSNSTFSSGTNWVPGSELTEVFHGSIYCSTADSGNVTINFDNAFEWDGTSNVVVAFLNNQGSYDNYGDRFYTHSTTGSKVLYWYTDNSAYNINAPGSGTLSSTRNNMKFCFGPEPTCYRPTHLAVSNITATSADLNWYRHSSNDNSFEVVCVLADEPVSSGTIQTASDTTFTLTGLTDNTEYDVYLRTACSASDQSEWVKTTFRTECVTHVGIPYIETFNGYGSGGQDTYAPCWSRYTNNTTQYPYINANGQLYFYSYNNYYSLAVSQAIDLSTYSAGTLALGFWIAQSAATYGRMDIGYMTDPTNMNTFVLLKSFYPSDYNQVGYFQQEYITLNQAFTTPVYFAFYAPAPGTYTTNYVHLDNVTVDLIPECTAPNNLAVSNVTGTSALVTWDAAQYGSTGYTLEYGESGQALTSVSVTGTSYQLTGLTQGTEYDVLLYSNCTGGNSDSLTTNFTTLSYLECQVPDTVGTEITGTTTATTYLIPVNNFYNYTYSQQIFTADEIDSAHTPTVITALGINYGYSSQNTDKTNVKVYLAHRSTSTFTGTSDWTPISAATLVYEGPFVCSQGWNTFNFDTYFSYNGSDNLVLIVDDNSGGYDGSSYVFNAHTTSPDYRTLYYQSDGTNPDPASPPTGNRTYNRNNVKFFKCNQVVPVSCPLPYVYVNDADNESVSVAWIANGSETQWNLEYRAAGATDWTSEGTVTTSPYTISNLNADVNYEIRLQALCSATDSSEWAYTSAHTPCQSVELPYTENFDNVTGNFVGCWSRLYNTTTATPSVTTAQHYSGTNSLYFNCSAAGKYAYAITPRFDDAVDMDDLQIMFYAYKASAAYFIEVGIMSDPTDVNTFVSLGQFSPSTINTWEMGEVMSNNYTGTGRYVAFRIPNWIANYMYIDDIDIHVIPNCVHVTNVYASTILTDGATITWTAGGTESQWNYVYGPAGTVDPTTATPTLVSENTATITGLTPNTLYDVYVQAYCSAADQSAWMHSSFRTECAAMTTLPYSENFDSYVGTTSTSTNIMPSCWASINGGTSYAGLPTTYQTTSSHSGNNCMYFYTYSSTNYADQYAVLPEIDTVALPINTMMLKMYMRSASTSYPFSIQVGVMSNPSDASTFVPVTTVQVNGTTFQLKEAYLNSYAGGGNYIALKVTKPTSGYNYGYIDDVELSLIPSCSPVYDLTVSNIAGASALISWNPGPIGTVEAYTIEYSEAGQENWITASNNLTTTSYLLSNLQPTTAYDVRVKTACSDATESNWETASFITRCLAGGEMTIGNGTSTSSYLPTYGCYRYSLTQQLFTSAEMNGSTMIRGVKFYVGTTTSDTRNVTVYMGNTTQTSVTSSTYVPTTNQTQVYTGPMSTATSGWVELTFTAPFNYTGGNMVLTVDDNTGSYVCSPSFAVHSGSSIYYYSDSNNPDPSSSTPCSFNTTSYRNNVIFLANCDSLATCIAPNIMVNNITTTSADVVWAAGYQETAWELDYTLLGDSVWTPISNPTGNLAQLTGLTANTQYQVRMKSLCGAGDESGYNYADFRTACGVVATLPYSENFDSYGTGSTAYPTCWDRINTYAGGDRPYVSSSYSSSAPGSLYFYATTGTYNIAILPEFDQSIDLSTLQVAFNYLAASSVSSLIIGIMSDANDASTFVAIDTISNTSTYSWYAKTVYLSSYAGTGKFIAFKNESNGSTIYGYLDDVVVSVAPSCLPVLNVTATGTSTTTASVSWTAQGAATSWNIEYGPTGFTQGSGTTVAATTNPYTLTGLTASTAYDVYVQSDCGGGDVSAWSTVAQFATQCESTTTFPYTEDFENGGNMPTCWSQEANYDDEWVFQTGAYDYSSVSTAHSGTYNAYFFSSDGYSAKLISPVFDLTQVTNPYISYWYSQEAWGGDQDMLTVYYRTSATSSWTLLTSHTSSVATWTFDSLALPNPSSTYQIAFDGTGSYGYGITVDDITIAEQGATPPSPETCDVPTNVTASNVTYNSASINWTAGGDETAWNLQYKKATDASWSSSIAVTSRPHTLSNLVAETAYQVRVQANCGAGETSDWSTVANFTTAATPADPCNAPTNLQVSNITQTSAVATWTAGGNETSWNVQYKLTSATEWYNATVNTPTYTIEGLTAASEYTVQVQAVCSATNMSGWVSKNFTTLTTGVGSVELANSINIMPNPAESYIELTINSNVTIEEATIYNAFGQMIQKVSLNNNHARIDVSNMAAGMYFVRIANDNSMATKKFIKK